MIKKNGKKVEKTAKGKILRSTLSKVAAGIVLLTVPHAAQAEVCVPTRAMVEDAMPKNLEQDIVAMLQASGGTDQLADRFRPKTQILNMAFSDKLKPNNDQCVSRDRGRDIGLVNCQWKNAKEGSTLDVNLVEGTLNYFSPGKREGSGRPHKVSFKAAEKTVGKALDRLGFPKQEISGMRTRATMAYRFPADPNHPPQRAWLNVQASREWNGFPVEGSQVRASINEDGQIYSLSGRWPDFQPAPNLSPDFQMSKAELIHEISRTLERDFPCQKLGNVIVQPVFAEESTVAGGSRPPHALLTDQPKTLARSQADFFVPALQVIAIPSEEIRSQADDQSTALPIRIRSFPVLNTGGF